ncbi:MAG TPA: response regulator transcription factor [Jiangellaceae bacterium]
MAIRVLLADDQTLVRSGFRVLLDRTDDVDVVGEVSNGADALDAVRATQPDVVLMDIRMPMMDGLEATRQIVSDPETCGVRVIMLTTFELDQYVFDAIDAGASGFLLKDVEPDDLRAAIRVVAHGDALLSPRVTRRLIAEFAARPGRRPHSPDALAGLTDREREVLALVATGKSNDEIARQLVISPTTVKTHVSRILVKLDARDRAQLVVIAYESGIVKPSPAHRDG